MFLNKKAYFFLLILFTAHFAYSQGDLINLYTFRQPNSSSTITIKVKKSKIKCEDAGGIRKLKNKVSIENSATVESEIISGKLNKYFSWNLEVITCEGIRKIIPFSIDLGENSSEGIVDLPDLTFEAKEFKIVVNSVKNQRSFEKERIIRDPNIAPTHILAADEVFPYEDLILSAEGGKLTQGSKYLWMEGDCNGKIIHKSESKILKIKAGTTNKKYFVLIIDEDGEKTECASIEIKISKKSKSADKIIALNKVCSNESKAITLEVVGGRTGEGANGKNAEWTWRTSNESGSIIGRGEKIKIDQPQKTTTYFVSPEGANKVAGVMHTVEVVDPSDLTNASILNNLSNICEGQKVSFELIGAKLGTKANLKWYESNSNHLHKLISENINFNWFPIETSKYELIVEDVCIISKKLQSIIEVKENSKLPNQIVVDSSAVGRKVKLKIDYHTSKLNLGSQWIWYKDHNLANFDSLHKPLDVRILNIGNNEIDLRTTKEKTHLYLKAFGDCESPNKFVDIYIPRKIDKYLFATVGISSNDLSNLKTLNLTFGSHRLYIRTKQSFNSNSISGFQTYAFNTDGNRITNFPYLTNNYYSFNEKKISIRSSYTLGFFLNLNNLSFFIGGGIGNQDYYNGVDISSYQTNKTIQTTWAKNTNFNNHGLEIETGLKIKIANRMILMGGVSYVTGTNNSNPYISLDCNLGWVIYSYK